MSVSKPEWGGLVKVQKAIEGIYMVQTGKKQRILQSVTTDDTLLNVEEG